MADHLQLVVINDGTIEDAAKPEPLKFGGGGGTYNGMDIVDAKIAAAEARTDAKFERLIGEIGAMRAELSGKIDVVGVRASHIETLTTGLRLNIWLAAATAIGLAVAAMAFGATNFGNGIMVTTATIEDASEAKRIASENAAEVRALRTDIQGIIQALTPQNDNKAQPELQFQLPMHRDGSN